MDNIVHKTQLPKILDERGSLSFLEYKNHIPFSIKTTYIINNLSLCQKFDIILQNRDKHFLIVLSGYLDIRIKYNNFDKIFTLNKPNEGLLIPELSEIVLIDSTTKLILLILCGDDFSE